MYQLCSPATHSTDLCTGSVLWGDTSETLPHTASFQRVTDRQEASNGQVTDVMSCGGVTGKSGPVRRPICLLLTKPKEAVYF